MHTRTPARTHKLCLSFFSVRPSVLRVRSSCLLLCRSLSSSIPCHLMCVRACACLLVYARLASLSASRSLLPSLPPHSPISSPLACKRRPCLSFPSYFLRTNVWLCLLFLFLPLCLSFSSLPPSSPKTGPRREETIQRGTALEESLFTAENSRTKTSRVSIRSRALYRWCVYVRVRACVRACVRVWCPQCARLCVCERGCI